MFLTGHTGFKGSWLTLWLQSLGARVTGYALEPPTMPSLYDQARVSTSVRSIVADIRDFPRLTAAMAEVAPEIVIHMAAQSVVKRGYADPTETYAVNVLGTVNVFEAARQLEHGCVVVNVTSDKCYAHSGADRPFREGDPMGGDDPYSSSKACAELVTTTYRKAFLPALASARAGNAIGGGDWTADQLIPDLVRAFQGGRPALIRNPDGIRPWQFVLEPLRGYLMLAERLVREPSVAAAGWNFGPADPERPVSWIADRLAESWGSGASWVQDGTTHPAESAVLRLDASRAAACLGWRPALTLEQALEWTLEWYRAVHAGSDPRRLTAEQIARYEERAA